MNKIPNEINEYMTSVLMRSKDAMDLVLWTEAVDDAKLATALGVNTDSEYRDFHYIDHFVEDLVEDVLGINITESQEDDLKSFMFSVRNELDFTNLSSFRPALLKWVDGKGIAKKEAYPNILRNVSKLPTNDDTKWAKMALKVRTLYLKNGNESDALLKVSNELEPPENLEFASWYKFKFGSDKSLYNLNDKIRRSGEHKMKTSAQSTKFALMYDSDSRYYLPKMNPVAEVSEEVVEPLDPYEVIKNEEDREKLYYARSKLVGRTFAIDKLMEKYRDVIDDAQLHEIEDALNNLRKKVRSLKFASTMSDAVIKTANQLGAKGFESGKKALLSAAEELQGFKKMAVPSTAGLPSLILELERIDQSLKRRDLARDIAKVDFKLHDMDLSGLFPEISDAQSRLIDAYTYASNKIKEIIPKMRSTQPGAGGKSEIIPVDEMLPVEESDSAVPDVPSVNKQVPIGPASTNPSPVPNSPAMTLPAPAQPPVLR